ncbi:hypothetical protein P7K49_036284 [Saguinus oedipus]|uniref:Uncharacterized protein n=1 Tax=Saguinus oedipus TaxID=9490 RepID=A0ABQ9TJU0_SAGOE|nr:hypothetical protein P7K49_036284 [Saguinus oedipus]
MPETLREGVSRTLPGSVSSLPRFDLGHPPRGSALVSKPRDPCFSALLSGEGVKKESCKCSRGRGGQTRNWPPPMPDQVETSQKISGVKPNSEMDVQARH